MITWRDGIGNIIGSFQTIQNLGPGNYSVEVTASDGCTNTKTITILDVPGFNISVNVTNALCANTEGQAIVTVNGNPPGFTYEWSRNGNPSIIATSNILMAGAGLYDLSVIDP
nr:hypothetical protein [Saprospiraceae bacterium]